MVHIPANRFQQRSDPLVAIATVKACQFNNGEGQRIFVVGALGLAPLCGAVLFQQATSPAFGNAKLIARMVNEIAFA